MKALLAFLFLFQSGPTERSPFDGAWIIDSAATQLPQTPLVLLLANGMFGLPGQQNNADGTDQKVPATGYWSTIRMRVVDERTRANPDSVECLEAQAEWKGRQQKKAEIPNPSLWDQLRRIRGDG
jgi:hypothetical protein